MSKYTLITDVTADLDARTYEELGVVCIPMGFMFGDTEYMHHADEREMSISEFYERLKSGEMPKTAQINPLVYREYFEESLKAGKDVLYLAFSSGLSGSCATASRRIPRADTRWWGRTTTREAIRARATTR